VPVEPDSVEGTGGTVPDTVTSVPEAAEVLSRGVGVVTAGGAGVAVDVEGVVPGVPMHPAENTSTAATRASITAIRREVCSFSISFLSILGSLSNRRWFGLSLVEAIVHDV
jgi:hypothetical protein